MKMQTPCPMGSECGLGSAAPTVCSERFYTSSTGQETCLNCPERYYCTGGIIIECPEGKYCTAGVDKVKDRH